MSPGPSLLVTIEDDRVLLDADPTSFVLPLGPLTLWSAHLGDGDPPSAASLTNALGLVADHLDDVLIEAPHVAGVSDVTVAGDHAMVVAAVELGHVDVPTDYVLHRTDADEVFRTVALETTEDRRHNPGLPDTAVESILGTCCVILGLMRRLDLSSVNVRPSSTDRAAT